MPGASSTRGRILSAVRDRSRCWDHRRHDGASCIRYALVTTLLGSISLDAHAADHIAIRHQITLGVGLSRTGAGWLWGPETAYRIFEDRSPGEWHPALTIGGLVRLRLRGDEWHGLDGGLRAGFAWAHCCDSAAPDDWDTQVMQLGTEVVVGAQLTRGDAPRPQVGADLSFMVPVVLFLEGSTGLRRTLGPAAEPWRWDAGLAMPLLDMGSFVALPIE